MKNKRNVRAQPSKKEKLAAKLFMIGVVAVIVAVDLVAIFLSK